MAANINKITSVRINNTDAASCSDKAGKTGKVCKTEIYESGKKDKGSKNRKIPGFKKIAASAVAFSLISGGFSGLMGTVDVYGTAPSSSVPAESTQPVTTLPADYSEDKYYSPENPKDRSLNPVMRDISALQDISDESLEKYREEIKKYADRQYPMFTWKVINLRKITVDGKDTVKADVYSEESIDVHMTVSVKDTELKDTFREDVTERFNTMDRWRLSLSETLNSITEELYPADKVRAEISFDFFPENIPFIKLDSAPQLTDRNIKKALEVIIEDSEMTPEDTAEAADQVFSKLISSGYESDEYYIRTSEKTKEGEPLKFSWFIIPRDLIGTREFKNETVNALKGENSSIVPSKRNGN